MARDTSTETPSYGYLADKASLVRRLRRIEGQVRGVERMVDEERYCIDILTQLSAIASGLDAVALKLLSDHVQSCVAGALASRDRGAADEKTRELLEAVERFTKAR
jgi:DNA-binding FrmR family transcriptional regulator